MDKMFSKKINFGGIKESMQNAQQELSTGWKNIAEKAKKEAKMANKKARKLMEMEDGGTLRHEYILAVNLNAGHDVFKRFQENWATMHEQSMHNVKKCDRVDGAINSFAKDYQKSRDLLNEFQANLQALPEVLSRVEIAQSRIDSIDKQVKQIEGLLLEYEEACERLELEKQKVELKVKLSQLVETKQAEYTLKKQIVEGSPKKSRSSPSKDGESSSVRSRLVASPPPKNTKDLEKRNSMERQKAYQDAFLDQMNEYIRSGEVEKPIAGSAGFLDTNNVDVDIEIGDSDFSALSEFLGPEEMNSVLQASASQQTNKLLRTSTSSADSSDTTPKDTAVDVDKSSDIKSLIEGSVNVERRDSDNKTECVDKPEAPVADTGDESTEKPENVDDDDDDDDVIEVTKDVEPDVVGGDEKKTSLGNSDDEFFDADE